MPAIALNADRRTSNLFAYLAGYLANSLRRVYGATWVATTIKTIALVFGYAMILAISLEFASSLAEPAFT